MSEFKKILIANRGEIAIRVMRAANELGKRTVAIYAEEDKLSLHRFKADEAYKIGEGLGPVAAYLSIDEIIRVAKLSGADAIHPGYGLLSENPDFVDACAANGITFIGPKADTMRALGDKASARRVAVVEHHRVAVGVGHVQRLRDAMVRGTFKPVASLQDALQGIGQVGAFRVDDGQVEQPRGAGRGRLAALALPGIQPDVVMVVAGGHEGGLVAVLLLEAEPQHADIKADGAVEVRHLEVNVADTRTR